MTDLELHKVQLSCRGSCRLRSGAEAHSRRSQLLVAPQRCIRASQQKHLMADTLHGLFTPYEVGLQWRKGAHTWLTPLCAT